MITIVMGRPGAGKSTYLAINSYKQQKNREKIYKKIEKAESSKKNRDMYISKMIEKAKNEGKKVYSNVYIKDCIKLDPHNDLNYFMIEDALIIIDEAGFEHNSRNWKQFGDNLYRFYTMHRHYNCDVILAVQMWDRIDLCIREVTEKIVIVKPTFLKKYFIKACEVNCNIDVRDGQIMEWYEYVPWYLGGCKYYWRKKAMTLFDSYYRDPLQEKENWEVW